MLPSDVRTAIASALSALPELHVYEIEPDTAVAPCAIIGQLSLDYDKSMARGLDYATVDVVLAVKQISSRAGQVALDGYLASTGTGSIKTVLETDRTLDATVSDFRVLSATPGAYESGGTTYLAYRYRLEVWG